MAADDQESIKRLNKVTVENVQNENLRLRYVAAQSADIDVKINCAITETMKIYKRALGTATGLGLIPTAASIHLNTSAKSVCKAIGQCFGLPRVIHGMVYEIVKSHLWNDLDHDFSVITPNSRSAAYLTSTETVSVALTAGILNIPLVLLVTTRLILILASDLILLLVRASKQTTRTWIGHPQLKDVENAVSYYRPSSSKVHAEISELVPRWNLVKTYRYEKVRLGLEEILHRWKVHIMKDVNPSLPNRSRGGKLQQRS